MKTLWRRFGQMVGMGLVLLMGAQAVSAKVRPAELFADHAVLQREKPIVVWGWADPSEKVKVVLGSKQKETRGETQANDRGEWKVILPAMPAGGPYTLTVRGTNTITLTDILVGEVWVCSGQSNMWMGVGLCLNAEKEMAAADYPGIRLLVIPQGSAVSPQSDVGSTWNVCSPATIGKGGWGGFSAAAYYFGREIHKRLGVPVGLIQSTRGGTRIEPWTSLEGFAAVPALKTFYDQAQPKKLLAGDKDHGRPTVLYNKMIHPLVSFPIRGVLWYQGESNRLDGMLYLEKMKALINGWRQAWNEGNFPFYYVQIVPYDNPDLPEFWAAQTAVQNVVPNTGMIVTLDIAEPTNTGQDAGHPMNKQDVGKRLALLALANTYGQKGLVCSGPTYKSLTIEGDKIRVSFNNVGGGLVSRGGKPLEWFEIADEEKGGFVKAQAVIDGATVVLWAAGVKHPTAVRFAWGQTQAYRSNLMNREGLPAGPFRAGKAGAR
jgi:sialate O-acetylesterase